MKEFKSNDELIKIMKSRNIKINDHEIELVKQYLDKNIWTQKKKLINDASSKRSYLLRAMIIFNLNEQYSFYVDIEKNFENKIDKSK